MDSNNEVVCRICRLDVTAGGERLLNPCKCDGSIKYVHQSCIDRWISQSPRLRRENNNDRRKKPKCELCGFEFVYKPIYHTEANKRLTWRQVVKGAGELLLCNELGRIQIVFAWLVWIVVLPVVTAWAFQLVVLGVPGAFVAYSPNLRSIYVTGYAISIQSSILLLLERISESTFVPTLRGLLRRRRSRNMREQRRSAASEQQARRREIDDDDDDDPVRYISLMFQRAEQEEEDHTQFSEDRLEGFLQQVFESAFAARRAESGPSRRSTHPIRVRRSRHARHSNSSSGSEGVDTPLLNSSRCGPAKRRRTEVCDSKIDNTTREEPPKSLPDIKIAESPAAAAAFSSFELLQPVTSFRPTTLIASPPDGSQVSTSPSLELPPPEQGRVEGGGSPLGSSGQARDTLVSNSATERRDVAVAGAVVSGDAIRILPDGNVYVDLNYTRIKRLKVTAVHTHVRAPLPPETAMSTTSSSPAQPSELVPQAESSSALAVANVVNESAVEQPEEVSSRLTAPAGRVYPLRLPAACLRGNSARVASSNTETTSSSGGLPLQDPPIIASPVVSPTLPLAEVSSSQEESHERPKTERRTSASRQLQESTVEIERRAAMNRNSTRRSIQVLIAHVLNNVYCLLMVLTGNVIIISFLGLQIFRSGKIGIEIDIEKYVMSRSSEFFNDSITTEGLTFPMCANSSSLYARDEKFLCPISEDFSSPSFPLGEYFSSIVKHENSEDLEVCLKYDDISWETTAGSSPAMMDLQGATSWMPSFLKNCLSYTAYRYYLGGGKSELGKNSEDNVCYYVSEKDLRLYASLLRNMKSIEMKWDTTTTSTDDTLIRLLWQMDLDEDKRSAGAVIRSAFDDSVVTVSMMDLLHPREFERFFKPVHDLMSLFGMSSSSTAGRQHNNRLLTSSPEAKNPILAYLDPSFAKGIQRLPRQKPAMSLAVSTIFGDRYSPHKWAQYFVKEEESKRQALLLPLPSILLEAESLQLLPIPGLAQIWAPRVHYVVSANWLESAHDRRLIFTQTFKLLPLPMPHEDWGVFFLCLLRGFLHLLEYSHCALWTFAGISIIGAILARKPQWVLDPPTLNNKYLRRIVHEFADLFYFVPASLQFLQTEIFRPLLLRICIPMVFGHLIIRCACLSPILDVPLDWLAVWADNNLVLHLFLTVLIGYSYCFLICYSLHAWLVVLKPQMIEMGAATNEATLYLLAFQSVMFQAVGAAEWILKNSEWNDTQSLPSMDDPDVVGSPLQDRSSDLGSTHADDRSTNNRTDDHHRVPPDHHARYQVILRSETTANTLRVQRAIDLCFFHAAPLHIVAEALLFFVAVHGFLIIAVIYGAFGFARKFASDNFFPLRLIPTSSNPSDGYLGNLSASITYSVDMIVHLMDAVLNSSFEIVGITIRHLRTIWANLLKVDSGLTADSPLWLVQANDEEILDHLLPAEMRLMGVFVLTCMIWPYVLLDSRDDLIDGLNLLSPVAVALFKFLGLKHVLKQHEGGATERQENVGTRQHENADERENNETPAVDSERILMTLQPPMSSGTAAHDSEQRVVMSTEPREIMITTTMCTPETETTRGPPEFVDTPADGADGREEMHDGKERIKFRKMLTSAMKARFEASSVDGSHRRLVVWSSKKLLRVGWRRRARRAKQDRLVDNRTTEEKKMERHDLSLTGEVEGDDDEAFLQQTVGFVVSSSSDDRFGTTKGDETRRESDESRDGSYMDYHSVEDELVVTTVGKGGDFVQNEQNTRVGNGEVGSDETANELKEDTDSIEGDTEGLEGDTEGLEGDTEGLEPEEVEGLEGGDTESAEGDIERMEKELGGGGPEKGGTGEAKDGARELDWLKSFLPFEEVDDIREVYQSRRKRKCPCEYCNPLLFSSEEGGEGWTSSCSEAKEAGAAVSDAAWGRHNQRLRRRHHNDESEKDNDNEESSSSVSDDSTLDCLEEMLDMTAAAAVFADRAGALRGSRESTASDFSRRMVLERLVEPMIQAGIFDGDGLIGSAAADPLRRLRRPPIAPPVTVCDRMLTRDGIRSIESSVILPGSAKRLDIQNDRIYRVVVLVEAAFSAPRNQITTFAEDGRIESVHYEDPGIEEEWNSVVCKDPNTSVIGNFILVENNNNSTNSSSSGGTTTTGSAAGGGGRGGAGEGVDASGGIGRVGGEGHGGITTTSSSGRNTHGGSQQQTTSESDNSTVLRVCLIHTPEEKSKRATPFEPLVVVSSFNVTFTALASVVNDEQRSPIESRGFFMEPLASSARHAEEEADSHGNYVFHFVRVLAATPNISAEKKETPNQETELAPPVEMKGGHNDISLLNGATDDDNTEVRVTSATPETGVLPAQLFPSLSLYQTTALNVYGCLLIYLTVVMFAFMFVMVASLHTGRVLLIPASLVAQKLIGRLDIGWGELSLLIKRLEWPQIVQTEIVLGDSIMSLPTSPVGLDSLALCAGLVLWKLIIRYGVRPLARCATREGWKGLREKAQKCYDATHRYFKKLSTTPFQTAIAKVARDVTRCLHVLFLGSIVIFLIDVVIAFIVGWFLSAMFLEPIFSWKSSLSLSTHDLRPVRWYILGFAVCQIWKLALVQLNWSMWLSPLLIVERNTISSSTLEEVMMLSRRMSTRSVEFLRALLTKVLIPIVFRFSLYIIIPYLALLCLSLWETYGSNILIFIASQVKYRPTISQPGRIFSILFHSLVKPAMALLTRRLSKRPVTTYVILKGMYRIFLIVKTFITEFHEKYSERHFLIKLQLLDLG